LLLDDPTDVSALADALTRLANDPWLCQRLALAANDFAAQHLWREAAQKQESVYMVLAQQTRHEP